LAYATLANWFSSYGPALGAFIAAAATIALALLAYYGLRGAGKQVRVLTDFYGRIFRPYVSLSLDVIRWGGSSPFILTIANRGLITATDVEFEVLANAEGITWQTVCSKLGIGTSTSTALGPGIASLAPQQSFVFPFGSGQSNKAFGGNEFMKTWPDPLIVRASYKSLDDDRTVYQEDHKLSPRLVDWVSLDNLHTESKTEKRLENISDELKSIRRLLEQKGDG
jgi:hypothetical protein